MVSTTPAPIAVITWTTVTPCATSRAHAGTAISAAPLPERKRRDRRRCRCNVGRRQPVRRGASPDSRSGTCLAASTVRGRESLPACLHVQQCGSPRRGRLPSGTLCVSAHGCPHGIAVREDLTHPLRTGRAIQPQEFRIGKSCRQSSVLTEAAWAGAKNRLPRAASRHHRTRPTRGPSVRKPELSDARRAAVLPHLPPAPPRPAAGCRWPTACTTETTGGTDSPAPATNRSAGTGKPVSGRSGKGRWNRLVDPSYGRTYRHKPASPNLLTRPLRDVGVSGCGRAGERAGRGVGGAAAAASVSVRRRGHRLSRRPQPGTSTSVSPRPPWTQ